MIWLSLLWRILLSHRRTFSTFLFPQSRTSTYRVLLFEQLFLFLFYHIFHFVSLIKLLTALGNFFFRRSPMFILQLFKHRTQTIRYDRINRSRHLCFITVTILLTQLFRHRSQLLLQLKYFSLVFLHLLVQRIGELFRLYRNFIHLWFSLNIHFFHVFLGSFTHGLLLTWCLSNGTTQEFRSIRCFLDSFLLHACWRRSVWVLLICLVLTFF